MLADTHRGFIHGLRIGGIHGDGLGEVELRHLLCGEQVDVGVRDIETGDDKARPRSVISSLDSLTDFLRDAGNMQPGLSV